MESKQPGKKAKRSRKNIQHRLSMRIIAVLLFAVCGILFYKTYQVDQKIDQYAAVKDDINTQIANEKSDQKDIKDQISYINSNEYIEEQAREKLGLVFDNEIIFKKQNR